MSLIFGFALLFVLGLTFAHCIQCGTCFHSQSRTFVHTWFRIAHHTQYDIVARIWSHIALRTQPRTVPRTWSHTCPHTPIRTSPRTWFRIVAHTWFGILLRMRSYIPGLVDSHSLWVGLRVSFRIWALRTGLEEPPGYH